MYWCSCSQRNHPEDGHMSGRSMLVTITKLKYINQVQMHLLIFNTFYALLKVKVKWSRYRPGVAQRMGRYIALLFHDRGTRRGWVVSSTPRPHFTPRKDPVPILQEAGWTPGPVWTGGKSRPHRESIPDRPARSQSLYWLSYLAHLMHYCLITFKNTNAILISIYVIFNPVH